MDIKPTLYVVATPIGNLADFSQRAIDTLNIVDLIYAEDTRQSAKLLQHYNIQKPLIALHKHNESTQTKQLIANLLSGKNVALVSDAGTPLIADPGASILSTIRTEHVNTIDIKVIPGCCSVVAALSISGLAGNQFLFAGFIPSQKKARQDFLTSFKYKSETSIFFETPHRIADTLADFQSVYQPKRRIFIARELTKTFEQGALMPVDECLSWINADSNRQRGEFVIILEGTDEQAPKDWQTLLSIMIDTGVSSKDAANIIAKMGYASKKQAYQASLERQQ